MKATPAIPDHFPVGEFVPDHFAHRGFGGEFEMEVEWIRKHMSPGAKRIVDVGCGNGSLMSAIGLQRVIGLDLQLLGLAYTRQRIPTARLVAGCATALPFLDNSLDVLTVQHVVEHLSNPAGAIREWYRTLTQGGLLLLVTPNTAFRDPSIFDDPSHVHLFKRDELASVVVQAGFEILHLCSIGLPWFRSHNGIPGGWRLRRSVLRGTTALSSIPGLRWRGQSLCCGARKP